MVKLSVYWIQTMVFGSSGCIPTSMRKHKEPRQRESKVQCIASRKLVNSRNSTEVHVLAVDDSIIDRKIIERLLKINAYKVTTVDSGMRALEVLGATDAQSHLSMNAFKINLIITDYCMPGMTGFELLKRVKETAALKEIPVVMMSSENVPNHIDRCLAEGAEDFLIKPVQLTDIQRLKAHIKITQQNKCPQGSRSNSCKKQKLSSAESPQNNSEKENHLRGVALV